MPRSLEPSYTPTPQPRENELPPPHGQPSSLHPNLLPTSSLYHSLEILRFQKLNLELSTSYRPSMSPQSSVTPLSVTA